MFFLVLTGHHQRVNTDTKGKELGVSFFLLSSLCHYKLRKKTDIILSQFSMCDHLMVT